MTNNAEQELERRKRQAADRQRRIREKKQREGLKQYTAWIPEAEIQKAKAEGWHFGGIWWSKGMEIGIELDKIVVEEKGKLNVERI